MASRADRAKTPGVRRQKKPPGRKKDGKQAPAQPRTGKKAQKRPKLGEK
jgi:hypothetical protein